MLGSTNKRWIVGVLCALSICVVAFLADQSFHEAPGSTEAVVRPGREVVAPVSEIAETTTNPREMSFRIPVVDPLPHVPADAPLPPQNSIREQPLGRLIVRLLDAHTGEPVERASYSTVGINGHLTPRGAIEGGELALDLPAGKAPTLRFFAEGYAERDLVLATGLSSGQEMVRVLRLNDREVVTIHVVDIDGAPVQGAELVVDAFRHRPCVRTSDEHGVATLPLIEDRRFARQVGVPWAVAEGSVRKPGYLPTRFEIVLASVRDENGEPTTVPARGHPRWLERGEREMHDAVVLLREATISGQVVDAYGMPVAYARVRVDWQGQPKAPSRAFVTDARGRWSVPDLTRAEAEVRLQESRAQLFDAISRGAVNGSIRLGPAPETRCEALPAGIFLRWSVVGGSCIYGEDSVLEPGLNYRTWRLDPTVPQSADRFGLQHDLSGAVLCDY